MSEFISVESMMKKLSISRAMAYALTKAPGFPSVRIGRRVLIPVDALEAWLAEQREAQHAERA